MDIIGGLRRMVTGTDATSTAQTADGLRDEEFLSDDGRVVRLLVTAGGYTWQGELRSALAWSGSKTSRTLSRMEAEGRITRYRIGRRNIVCIPHREPERLRPHPQYVVGR